MKKTLWTSLCILTLAIQSWAQDDKTVTIATFNCEFLTRPKIHLKFGLPFRFEDAEQAQQDEWNQPGFRDARFRESAQAVARVLAPIGADVLALSEVGNLTDTTELRDELRALGQDYPNVEVCDSRDFTTRQFVAVLSKFPLTGVVPRIPGREGYFREPDDPETEDDTGISKGMRVTVAAHQRNFHLYVLHLASERGGHEQDQQRIAQASLVRRHFLPDLQRDQLLIVAGDLNDKRGQPTLQRLRGFDDVYPDLIQTGLVNFFQRDAADTRYTFEFQGVRQQIDHVLLSRAVKDAAKGSKGIRARTVSHDEVLASDHRPLVVTLTLKD